jgi:hypothetical protein
MDFRRALKSGLRPGGAAEGVAFASAPCGFHAHGSLHMTPNMTPQFLIPIDRFAGSCTLARPDRILIPPRRFRMAIQAHLVELERKHKILENELHEALVHLSTDDLQIVELKRRKLMVKDEIERLRHTASETLH